MTLKATIKTFIDEEILAQENIESIIEDIKKEFDKIKDYKK